MTVDPELQKRAEDFITSMYGAIDFTKEDYVRSLALAFQRERLMGQIVAMQDLADYHSIRVLSEDIVPLPVILAERKRYDIQLAQLQSRDGGMNEPDAI